MLLHTFLSVLHVFCDIWQPCPESVPHHVAVHNRKVLLSSAESREGLAKQVSSLVVWYTVEIQLWYLTSHKTDFNWYLYMCLIFYFMHTLKWHKIPLYCASRNTYLFFNYILYLGLGKNVKENTWNVVQSWLNLCHLL